MRPMADASVLEPLRKRGTRDCLSDSEGRALALSGERTGPGRPSSRVFKFNLKTSMIQARQRE